MSRGTRDYNSQHDSLTGERRPTVVPLFPDHHPAHLRSHIADQITLLHDAGEAMQAAQMRREAVNVLTREEALEQARAEVSNSYRKLLDRARRAEEIARHYAGLYGATLDNLRNDLTPGMQHSLDYAIKVSAAGTFEFDRVCREFYATHPDHWMHRYGHDLYSCQGE